MYLTIIARGAFEGKSEEFKDKYEGLLKLINVSSQKDGIIERFIQSRCTQVFPKNCETRDNYFWQFLCFEVMYFWSLLSNCDSKILEQIIQVCKSAKDQDEPFFGLRNFIIAACFNFLRDVQSSILYYRKCVEECNENVQTIKLLHIPAFASYKLSTLLFKFGNCDEKLEAQKLLNNAKQFKNYDFEYRLKLKIQNAKILN